MQTHELKTWPEHFSAIVEGRKRFELRRDDRGFAEGDRLLLREWAPEPDRYTGRQVTVDVTYILRGPAFGLPENLAVLSIA